MASTSSTSTTTATDSTTIPQTMKAIRQHAYGEASKVLTMEDIPVPTAIGESVLIKVHSISINPVDYKLLRGDFQLVIRTKFPHTPGNDFAGTVVAVGSACHRLRVGDRVYGANPSNGTFAEYVLVEEKIASRMPSKASFEDAAAMSLVGETALTGFAKIGSLEGKRVLILGGSGGTGSLGIQIAKAKGAAYVATTCSSKNSDYVRALGADHVIDYTAVNFAEALSVEPPFDLVYDCVGGQEQWDNAQRILSKNGNFLTLIGDMSHDPVTVSNAMTTVGKVLSRKVASFVTNHNYVIHLNSPSFEALDELTKFYDEGKIRTDTLISKRFSFTLPECVSLFQESESGHTRGKAVLNMVPETSSVTMA